MVIAKLMIARLREEKKMLLTILDAVEDWAFGEGHTITPSLKAKIKTARQTSANEQDALPIDEIIWQDISGRKRRRMTLSPEERERRSKQAKEMTAKRLEKP